jgi:hypothetical protein
VRCMAQHRCTECRTWFAPAVTARGHQRVCGAGCKRRRRNKPASACRPRGATRRRVRAAREAPTWSAVAAGTERRRSSPITRDRSPRPPGSLPTRPAFGFLLAQYDVAASRSVRPAAEGSPSLIDAAHGATSGRPGPAAQTPGSLPNSLPGERLLIRIKPVSGLPHGGYLERTVP